MDLGYRGRRIVVVGASEGIGHAAAAQMVGEGGDVVLVSRSENKLAAAADAISRSHGVKPGIFVCDVTQSGAGDELARLVETRWGALDVLVSAVGGSVRSEFAALDDEAWLSNYNFNVLSTVRAVRALLPFLKKGNAPAIVTLGGAAAKMPYANQVASNVHKAGLIGLTKTLAAEFARTGIRVNSVAPGRTLTSLWTTRADTLAAEQNSTPEAVLAHFAYEIPLGRFAEADEIAVGVVWLASPRASYITGQTLNVDGGIARGLL